MLKKGIIFLLFFAPSLQYAFSQKTKHNETDLNKMGYVGKVKQVKYETYKAIDNFGQITQGEEDNNNPLDGLTTFDPKGYRLSSEREGTSLFSKATFVNKTNDKGLIIERSTSFGGVLDSRITYSYDESGNLREWKEYNFANALSEKMSFNYDNNGSTGEVISYEFGTTILLESFKYDLNGNVIEYILYSSGKQFQKKVYKYDSNQNCIEMSLYLSSGSLSHKCIYKYDEKGNEIEESFYNSDGSFDYKYKAQYEYDKNGNWIKKIQFKNDVPTVIRIRTIDYY